MAQPADNHTKTTQITSSKANLKFGAAQARCIKRNLMSVCATHRDSLEGTGAMRLRLMSPQKPGALSG